MVLIARSRRVPRLVSMHPDGMARTRLLDDVITRVRCDIGDESRDVPSLAIRPQDRVHIDIRHAAPTLQVCVRDG
jgi:hypothetical protein